MEEIITGTLTWAISGKTRKEVESANTFLMERLMNVPGKVRNATYAFQMESDGTDPITVTRGDLSPEMEAVMQDIFNEEEHDPEVKTAV